jgi:hypothetical protein
VCSPGILAEIATARTDVSRFRLHCRLITPNCWQRRLISAWSNRASQTCRTSSPVVASPSATSLHVLCFQ